MFLANVPLFPHSETMNDLFRLILCKAIGMNDYIIYTNISEIEG